MFAVPLEIGTQIHDPSLPIATPLKPSDNEQSSHQRHTQL
jgi:hypothetical protein